MSHIGYVRVSSFGQTSDRQLDGIDLDKVFTETASAKSTDRPQLQACLEYLRGGDTLHNHSIDRLARNLFDLQKIIEQLTSRGVSVQFHKENLTFSGSPDPMAKLTMQMMGAFAEFERTLINERRSEGIAKAKALGKQIGAKPKLDAAQVIELKARASSGEKIAALAKDFGISRQTVYMYLK